MRTIHKAVTPRVDAYLVRRGDLAARDYLAVEKGILEALKLFCSGRRLEILTAGQGDTTTGWIDTFAPSRINRRFVDQALGQPINIRKFLVIVKSIIRGHIWNFVQIDGRIGLFIYENLTITFSNLSAEEVELMAEAGLTIEEQPDLVGDESLWCSYYAKWN